MSGVSSLTVDTRHVTRYQEEINLNSFKSHFQCLDWLLILKLSLEEMMDYSTDDNVCNTSLLLTAFSPGPLQYSR